MKSNTFVVIAFLMSKVFGTMFVFKDTGTPSTARSDFDRIGTKAAASQISCGLRPVSMLARRLDSFQLDGLENSDTYDKILGGNYAVHGEIPWQVNIKIVTKYQDKIQCGGAILNAHWILSAAHCFTDQPASSLRVTVGDHHTSRQDAGEQQFNVSMIVSHEKFTSRGFDHDIALLKIQPGKNGDGMRFNSVVQPICLPTDTDYPKASTPLLASGWGKDSLSGESSWPIVKKTILPLVAQAECSRLYQGKITPCLFCAGYLHGQTDMCEGDSGGPAAYSYGDIYILYGIASFGTGCSWPNYPSVFTNVRCYLDWISNSIKMHSSSSRDTALHSRPEGHD